MAFKAPQPVRMELNLAPMVDVMMCLIIFFLLTAVLVNAENRPVNLPWAQAAEEKERKELGQRVVINIRPSLDDERIAEYVTVRPVARPGGGLDFVENPLTADQLNEFIQKVAKEKADLIKKGEFRCVIRADQEVMYRHIEVVLRACGLAKIGKITFTANKGKESD